MSEPKDTNPKDTNPKDAVGTRKAPLSALPIRVLWRVGLAMLEGALKYGRHNYRGVGVRASVYFDATCRHLFGWWEGEDTDVDSRLSHIDKAIACLMVLRDSMLQGNWTDDRPPRAIEDFTGLHAHASGLIDQYGEVRPKHWTAADKPLTDLGEFDTPINISGHFTTVMRTANERAKEFQS